MNNRKTEIKWALLFTSVGLLWMVLEKVTGLHSTYLDYQMYLTNLFAIPAIVMMVMALKEKKKKQSTGPFTYKEGLLSGSILSVFIALLSPFSQWVTSYIISPDYFPNVIERSVQRGDYPTREQAEAVFNFTNYAIQGAVGALVMGVVTTLIVMLFLKEK